MISKRHRIKRDRAPLGVTAVVLCGGYLWPLACVPVTPPDGDDGGAIYNNTTDPTNESATYVGSDACGACHPGVGEQHEAHGHAHILTPIQGQAPVFPGAATRAGVPSPPPGLDWSDISYVVGGYTRKAQFIDKEGQVLTGSPESPLTQWNLEFSANGSTPGFVVYEAETSGNQPYDYSCFKCHTTGGQTQNEDFPEFQENRPGILGTWTEAGVQCEACHGPGSNHLPNPSARDIFVGVAASNCGQCHTRGENPSVILSKNGFIQSYQQWPELLASGGHADFDCTMCHVAHVSANHDRENAIRNECTACHADQTMAIHEGLTFVRGDYSEDLTCVSCHMPFVTVSATSASNEVVGEVGRMGDTRTHIFRINTAPVDFHAFFSGDGASVVEDEEGRAAVTLDFVCFRCHNDIGNAGTIDSLDLASGVASNMHDIIRP